MNPAVVDKLKPIIKTAAILLLAGLAIFQAGQLWFVNLTDRNFILYLQARFPPGVPDEQEVFVRPMRMIYGTPERFAMRTGDMGPYWAIGANLAQGVLRSAEYVGMGFRADVFAGDVIVFEYAFSMQAEVFALAIGARNHNVPERAGIERFDAIAIKPASDTVQYARVFFIDDDIAHEFRLHPGRQNPQVDLAFEIPQPTRPFFYVRGGVLRPAPQDGFFYQRISAHNPYQNDFGLLHLSHIRALVAPFFNNPATINPSLSADGIYTFSNLNTMVRYLEFDVVEYTSFRTIGRTTPSSFLADFSAAFAFIEDDAHVINEFFLAGYEMRGRENVFWFDYAFDGFRIAPQSHWYTGPRCPDPLRAAIEVVVDHGRVVRYRRLAINFVPGGLTWFSMGHTDEVTAEIVYALQSDGSVDLWGCGR